MVFLEFALKAGSFDNLLHSCDSCLSEDRGRLISISCNVTLASLKVIFTLGALVLWPRFN